MSPVYQVWPKPSCKVQWKGEEDKADRGRCEKTTSGNGPGVRKVPEGSGEQGKMEETGCEIICDAQTTLAVKGQMTWNSPGCLCSFKIRLLQLISPSGSPQYILYKLQMVQNLAAKIAINCKHDHVHFLLQISLVTNMLNNWLQDFDPVLQHLLAVLLPILPASNSNTSLPHTFIHLQTHTLTFLRWQIWQLVKE